MSFISDYDSSSSSMSDRRGDPNLPDFSRVVWAIVRSVWWYFTTFIGIFFRSLYETVTTPLPPSILEDLSRVFRQSGDPVPNTSSNVSPSQLPGAFEAHSCRCHANSAAAPVPFAVATVPLAVAHAPPAYITVGHNNGQPAAPHSDVNVVDVGHGLSTVHVEGEGVHASGQAVSELNYVPIFEDGPATRYYCITAGRRVGVFNSW